MYPSHPDIDLLVARQHRRDLVEQARRNGEPELVAQLRRLLAAIRSWLQRHRRPQRALARAGTARPAIRLAKPRPGTV